MRGGYHIHAKKVERYARQPDGSLVLVDTWHEASSPTGKLHTVCGHRHSSYEEAAACIPAVEAAYRQKRWPSYAKIAAGIEG